MEMSKKCSRSKQTCNTVDLNLHMDGDGNSNCCPFNSLFGIFIYLFIFFFADKRL